MENGIPYYRARVYRFIVQFVKNGSLAEDLTQDIMLKMWSRHERLSALEDMDNYILKMAKNHVIDHFKKLAREKVYQEEIWRQMQKSANVVESKLAEVDIYNNLEAVLKTLPPRQQEVYTLNKREGLSLNEVASTLGITIRTARNHLDRALKVIRNNMNPDSFLFWIVLGLSHI
ncbi:sigma-70 family RNA polymerase sigma factor [Agriterribacter sp.]|uniref:RNA polymerase sigma factor n=1 Tax=Agriterribacter sp. TaxID=2821509 RepID=UPI002C2EEF6B|nr:sigma-70 family RNA polymerase sigma factor [Agriterribacter sp.]HRP54531.1 sigma-70 family RNA polymerase sigma factor [Agriterribacter sp.]